MTGNKLYERAMLMLGYTLESGSISDPSNLMARSVEITNQVLSDLGLKEPINALEDEICLSETQTQAVVYGLCMFFTLSLNDTERNALFTDLYNLKRGSAKSQISAVKEEIYKGVEDI